MAPDSWALAERWYVQRLCCPLIGTEVGWRSRRCVLEKQPLRKTGIAAGQEEEQRMTYELMRDNEQFTHTTRWRHLSS
jgi:hypothetical protein